MVVRAEELLGPQPQPVSTAGTGPEMFKPQSNLKLSFLDKQASHLEVHKCTQGAETPPPPPGNLAISETTDAYHLVK